MIKIKQKTTQPATSCRENVIAKMADTMRELAFAGDNVSPETLAHHGFTREVVDKFGDRAVALARRLSVHQVVSHA
jgi:enoyl-CoA hydratase/carnithine racemase